MLRNLAGRLRAIALSDDRNPEETSQRLACALLGIVILTGLMLVLGVFLVEVRFS